MTIKIDKIDQRILYELDKNCRIPDVKLAKIVRRSREAVRVRIQKLVSEGIILGFIASINPSKMGSMFFKLYVQIANVPKERNRLYDYLKHHSNTYWFGGNDGVWDLHATFFASSVSEFNTIKNTIFTEFKDIILKKEIGVLINVRQYPKKYLAPALREHLVPSIFAGDVENNETDNLSQRLISILSSDARISLMDLSKTTHSTVDIIRSRIKSLKDKGIILQYRIAVDHQKLGYEMFKAFLYFSSISKKQEEKLLEYASRHANILYLIRQLSAWDVEIEIITKSYQEFTTIMDDIRLKFSDCLRNYEFCLMREDIWVFRESTKH